VARLGRGDDADPRLPVERQIELASLRPPAQVERQAGMAGVAQLIQAQDAIPGRPAIGRIVRRTLLVVGPLKEELIAVVADRHDIRAGVQPQQRHIGGQQQQRRDDEELQAIEPIAAVERQRQRARLGRRNCWGIASVGLGCCHISDTETKNDEPM
jgi:hypothetical protein